MAQSFRRLGARVSLIERFAILAQDEPEAVDVVRRALQADGVELYEHTAVQSIARQGAGIACSIATDAGEQALVGGSHLLVAAGRKPNVAGLNLEAAGVTISPKGIVVDARLRTANKRIFAIGDVAGGAQFTHIAGYHAGIVIRNALFGLPAKVNYRALPWVTYADPELAHVGLTEAGARKAGHRVNVLSQPFSANDRAQAERRTEGLAKVVLGVRALSASA
jgi:pyruvate/2-oxoglutarate dehydrogenase complex dihydrolipoamide dehydrogenase (E3) component